MASSFPSARGGRPPALLAVVAVALLAVGIAAGALLTRANALPGGHLSNDSQVRVKTAKAYEDGYSNGDSSGHAAGYSSGYDSGKSAGYTEGYSAGEEAAQQAATTSANDAYTQGQSAGYSEGYAAGVSCATDNTSAYLCTPP